MDLANFSADGVDVRVQGGADMVHGMVAIGDERGFVIVLSALERVE